MLYGMRTDRYESLRDRKRRLKANKITGLLKQHGPMRLYWLVKQGIPDDRSTARVLQELVDEGTIKRVDSPFIGYELVKRDV